MQPLRILTVCTGNAGRSQIAQALARDFLGDKAHVESAGVEPWDALHPQAVGLLEGRSLLGKDQHPKSAESVADQWFDLVITMGDPARAKLPSSLRHMASWVHWDLPDPADADNTPDSPAVFRRTFEYIQKHLKDLLPLIQNLRPRPNTDKPLLGISSSMWKDADPFYPAKHLPQAAQAGFNALELCLFGSGSKYEASNPYVRDELLRVADDLGIQIVSVHAPDGGGLASDSEADRQRQMDILLHYLDIAEALGASTLVSHALLLGPFSENHATNDARLKTAMDELLPRVQASTVRIGFENGYVCRDGRWAADEINRMAPYSDAAFGFTFDTGHSNVAKDLGPIVNHPTPKLLSLHINDNLGTLDNHLPPGQGSVDWPAIASFLNKTGFRGCMMYEIPAGENGPEATLQAIAQWHAQFIQSLKTRPRAKLNE